MTDNGLPALMTTAEVAEFLRLSVGSVENWRGAGKGPPYVKIEGAVRYPSDKLLEWVAGSKAGAA